MFKISTHWDAGGHVFAYVVLLFVSIVYKCDQSHEEANTISWNQRQTSWQLHQTSYIGAFLFVTEQNTFVQRRQFRFDFPTSFDWRNINGMNYVTADINHHQPGPVYCGSCWTHASVSAINDRIKIERKAKFPDFMISPQVILQCVPQDESGCRGGDPLNVYLYMTEHGIPDSTCAPWLGSLRENLQCDDLTICRNNVHVDEYWILQEAKRENSSLCNLVDCTLGNKSLVEQSLSWNEWQKYRQEHGSLGSTDRPSKLNDLWRRNHPGEAYDRVYPIRTYISVGIRAFGMVAGELAMMEEIHARGPISCSMASGVVEFKYFYHHVSALHEGVYVETEPLTVKDIDHDVTVSGWGTTASGLKYWVIRNNWGTFWGDAGWFRLKRGSNNMFIEQQCAWGLPDLSNLTVDVTASVL